MYNRYRYLTFNTAKRDVDSNSIMNFIKCTKGIDLDSKWGICMYDDRGICKVTNAVTSMDNPKATIGIVANSTKATIMVSYGDTDDYTSNAFNLTMSSPVTTNKVLKRILSVISNEEFEEIRKAYSKYETKIIVHTNSYPRGATELTNQLDVLSSMFIN